MRAQTPRQLALPAVPREHGAWFIVGASALLGPAVTHRANLDHLLLAALALIGLFGRAALKGRRSVDHVWSAVFAAAGLLLGGLLLARQEGALMTASAAAAALLLGLHRWLEHRRLGRAIASELLAIGALTLVGPASLAISGAGPSSETLALAAANGTYFLTSVPYVRIRVFGPRRPEVWRSLRFFPIAFAAAGVVAIALATPPARVLAFAPVVIRGLLVAPRPPSPLASATRLGLGEAAGSVYYVVVMALIH